MNIKNYTPEEAREAFRKAINQRKEYEERVRQAWEKMKKQKPTPSAC